MSYLIKSAIFSILGLSCMTSEASAQYYTPVPAPHTNQHVTGGLDLGLRNHGFNPNAAIGVGQVGLNTGLGAGRQGLGLGVNTGIGPLGASADAGLGRNGVGARGSAGIGKTTGAAFNGGISRGGLSLGASAKILNVGAGASVGVGDRGPGLGANLGFGPLGTLLIGSQRNPYPGANTAANTIPNQRVRYYTPQQYGKAPYYRPAPVHNPYHAQRPPYTQPASLRAHQTLPQPQYIQSNCPAPWTC